MRIFSYCLLFLIFSTSCRNLRSMLLDNEVDNSITFVVGEDYRQTTELQLVFDSQKITDRPLKPLTGKIKLTIDKKLCSQDFTLARRTELEKPTCQDKSVNNNLKNTFIDKLYFFPRGNHCQLGRLVKETTQQYQVEFCGLANDKERFNSCVECHECEAKTNNIDKGNFDPKQASYPFDVFAPVQKSYRLEIKTNPQSPWRTKRVTLNGNGVLLVANKESCLFKNGCQVRTNLDSQCLTPEPLN